MVVRLRKRVKIIPDLSLNLSSKGTTIKVKIDNNGNVEYLNPNDGKPLPEKVVANIKKNNKEALISTFKQACKNYNDGLDLLDKLHLDVSPPSDIRVYNKKEYPEPPPKKEQLKNQSFLSKIFRFIEKKRLNINETIESEYNDKLNYWAQKKVEFDKNEIDKEYKINKLLASGNEEVINSELMELLSNIPFPKETNINFEINENNLILDIDLPEIEDIPNKKYTASDNSLKISIKTMSDTQRRKIYMTHIHSIIFRIIADVFSLIPTIKKITLSAYSQRPNIQNGNIENQYLLSVNIDKSAWKSINFNNIEYIDVVECFEQFDLIRNMSKTGIFKEITPFTSLIKDGDKITQEVINKFENLDEEYEVISQKVEQHDSDESFISPSIALIIGIIFLPYIFSWFTLKKGYSKTSKIISFTWMFLSILLRYSSD